MTDNLIGAQLVTQSNGVTASYCYIIDGTPTELVPVDTAGHDPLDEDGNVISTSYVNADGTVHEDTVATFRLDGKYVTVELNDDYRMIVTAVDGE